MSVFQSSSEQSIEEITRIGDVYYSSVTGLNNSDPDVMVTVTASNRAGQGNMNITVRLPPSLGKYYKLITAWYIRSYTHTYVLTYILTVDILKKLTWEHFNYIHVTTKSALNYCISVEIRMSKVCTYVYVF